MSGSGPAAPLTRSPTAPLIDVSGVRSSWLTVDTNSFFMRSMRLRSVMSAWTEMKRSSTPWASNTGVRLSVIQ